MEFNADDVISVAKLWRKPGGLVPSGGSTRVVPTLIPAPGVRIGANTLMSLEAEMRVMKYYKMVNLKSSASFLICDHIIKNFDLEFYDIRKCKKKEVSTPQTSQKLNIARWNETLLDFLSRIVGARNIPLARVVRPARNSDHDAPFEIIDDACCVEDFDYLE